MAAGYRLGGGSFCLEVPNVEEIAKGMPVGKVYLPYPREDDPSSALRGTDRQVLGAVLARPEVTAWTLKPSPEGQGLIALAGLVQLAGEWPRAFSYPIHPINAGVIPRKLALLGVVSHAFGEGAEAVQMLVHPDDRNGHKVAQGVGFHVMELAIGAKGFDQLVLPSPKTPLSVEELGGIDRDAAIATYLGALESAQIQPFDTSA